MFITSSVKQRRCAKPLCRANRVIPRMGLVCGFWNGHGYICHIRRGGRRRTSGLAPAIHKSIWSGMLCFPSHVAGHVCIVKLLCFYFYGEVVRGGVRLELPLCPGDMVVGQPHYALVGRAPAPRHRIGVTICAPGNFWLGARGHILWLLGH